VPAVFPRRQSARLLRRILMIFGFSNWKAGGLSC
jgi:hypothetical protein